MKRKLLLTCALAGLGILGCDLGGPSAPDSSGPLLSTVGGIRPMSVTLQGNANLIPTNDPCIFTNAETGSGNGTHLGAFVWSDVETVNFCTIPGGVSVVGSFVMTAANGDAVTGDLTTTGLFQMNGDLLIDGTYSIAGGTGRFVDATGQGLVRITAQLSPGLPFAGTMEGTIQY